jgi:putative SOS response-associated peptidase YedK
VLLRDGRRVYQNLQWGFKPAWSKTTLINSRADHLPESRFFAPLLRAGKRCLFVADGYYEFVEKDGLSLPFYTTLRDRGFMAFAGLWDEVRPVPPTPRPPKKKPDTGQLSFSLPDLAPEIPEIGDEASLDGEKPADAENGGAPSSAPRSRLEGEPRPAAFVITTDPNALMLQVGHDRMPVILDPGSWEAWLDPKTPVEALLPMLRMLDAARMQSWFVRPLVNRLAHDGPDCIEAVGGILTV